MSSTTNSQSSFVHQANDSVISVTGLTKNYGQVKAIRNIGFTIDRGEIFGLIGPDGAGKTSTFNILAGIMEPTSGNVRILSQPPHDVRPKIGYLTQKFSLHLDLSINENIEYCAGLRQISPEIFKQRSAKYLKLMGIEQFQNRLAGQLSGGMKQKLALCCALISRPEILLLDEPTTGVDPISRREFWDVLASISHEGVTIAVATPYLDEAERCSRVALMHDGEIYQMGTPAELKSHLTLKRLEVRSTRLSTLEQCLHDQLSKDSVIKDIQQFGDRLDVLVVDANIGTRFLESIAKEEGITDLKIEQQLPTLENVFVLSLQDHGSKTHFNSLFAPQEKVVSTKKNNQAIAATNISKSFDGFKAVSDVNLEIQYGEIYGLLGANGAGKTTTIKMLCGLLEPTSGQMKLAGTSDNLRSSTLRKRIGYMSQKFTLYDDLSVLENLEFYCGVYEVPLVHRKERINWALFTCGLTGQEKTLTGGLPGGWKQRLSFGASVMHKPEILFLDEPTSGVDPIARRQLWKMITDFAEHNAGILVTTHFLEEADHCQRLGFMANGKLVAQGSPTEIKASQPGKLFEIVTNKNQQAVDLLKQLLQPWRVAIFADRLHVVVDNPDKDFSAILSQLNNNGIKVSSHRTIPFSLEDAFIGIVQRTPGRSI